MRPSGWAVGVQPQNVLIRWCRRHSGARLPGCVAPAGHGVRWSRSQRWAGRLQPGKLHVMARMRTKAVSAVEGRYWRSAGRSAISESGFTLAPVATRSASMLAGMMAPSSVTPGLGLEAAGGVLAAGAAGSDDGASP